MSKDYKLQWIRGKTLDLLGLEDDSYFDTMLSRNEDLEEKLSSLLEEDFVDADDKEWFYVYKTTHEKLVEEEVMVPIKGNVYFPKLKFSTQYCSKSLMDQILCPFTLTFEYNTL